MIGQKFERNRAVQARVERFVNHSHSAGAELLSDAKVRDGLVDHCWTRAAYLTGLTPKIMLHPRLGVRESGANERGSIRRPSNRDWRRTTQCASIRRVWGSGSCSHIIGERTREFRGFLEGVG